MQPLTVGQRSTLASLRLPNALQISADVALPGHVVDIAIFGLDAQGKLGDDR
ncbi:MAG: hypothetical protein K9M02_08450 [Thiohalocapsa sp.]|nr:hypothetical protein [Thiohalocapsa sp.]